MQYRNENNNGLNRFDSPLIMTSIRADPGSGLTIIAN